MVYYPVYTLAMKNMRIVLCGFSYQVRDKLMTLIRHMGGDVEDEVHCDVTHVVALKKSTTTREAKELGIPIMAQAWVRQCWRQRHRSIDASAFELMQYTLDRHKVFAGKYLCFLGFLNVYSIRLYDAVDNHGGEGVPRNDPLLTHVVLNSRNRKEVFDIFENKYVVDEEWVWDSIRNGICPDDKKHGIYYDTHREEPLYLSVEDAVLGVRGVIGIRTRVIKDFFATEKNYLAMLSELLAMIKWNMPRAPPSATCSIGLAFSVNGPHTKHISWPHPNCKPSNSSLLTHEVIKNMFVNIRSIHKLHSNLSKQYESLGKDLTETTLIGGLFFKFCSEFQKHYPKCFNVYKLPAGTLSVTPLESTPYFQEFLYSCHHEHYKILTFNRVPESLTLQDILNRPVQRLKTIILTLQELREHTAEYHPDHDALEIVLDKMNAVSDGIDKDITNLEDSCNIFTVYNMILNCPPLLPGCKLVMQFEAIELNKKGLSKIGDHLVFCVIKSQSNKGDALSLVDTIEVCKVRSKVIDLEDVATPQQLLQETHGKPYKYLRRVLLKDVTRIFNIEDCSTVTNAFSIRIRTGEMEVTSSLQLVGNNAYSKVEMLENLITHLKVKNVSRTTAVEVGIQGRSIWNRAFFTKAARSTRKILYRIGKAMGLHKMGPKRLNVQLYGVENNRFLSSSRFSEINS